ncbi:DNA cytosine methyltransferase [Glutamicibacter sp. PS]|uniref:DNA cytosine methyltransferase n=1 Tax=Glutamicibacter sp. PS TaxID=3075634 RepID=UPI0028499972|nr:DNA cytosine methyltransferase [Glutamicibacter sp. PS]MDR4534420.1 DNA cytosine methyltransferase [Glutamicibacter sp. PS]
MKYVDLFSGCGGLSLGIEASGAKLVLAVEKSDQASRSFRHNLVHDSSNDSEWKSYLDLPLERQVEEKIVVSEVQAVLSNPTIMARLRRQKLDFVVGGPPCQGFSLAGRRERDDVRNELPYQFLEFVEQTLPRMVVIENVLGMGQSFEKGTESSFSQLRIALSELGYEVQGVQANALHYGAPQHRPRLLLVGLKQEIAASKGIRATEHVWRSHFMGEHNAPLPALVPRPTLRSSDMRVLSDAVRDLTSFTENRSPQSDYVLELNRVFAPTIARPDKGHKLSRNHVLRKHRPSTVDRFRLYHFLKAAGLGERILRQIADMDPKLSRLHIQNEIESNLTGVRAAFSLGLLPDYDEHSLVDLIENSATRKHSQKVLSWHEPARTVVTLPDDYIHPKEPRVFTVRELARMQGFPDNFVFLGPETTGAHRRKFEVPQYSQVGNAVSPWLGLAIGQMIHGLLNQ